MEVSLVAGGRYRVAIFEKSICRDAACRAWAKYKPRDLRRRTPETRQAASLRKISRGRAATSFASRQASRQLFPILLASWSGPDFLSAPPSDRPPEPSSSAVRRPELLRPRALSQSASSDFPERCRDISPGPTRPPALQ